jgi:hypothetical protein
MNRGKSAGGDASVSEQVIISTIIMSKRFM